VDAQNVDVREASLESGPIWSATMATSGDRRIVARELIGQFPNVLGRTRVRRVTTTSRSRSAARVIGFSNSTIGRTLNR